MSMHCVLNFNKKRISFNIEHHIQYDQIDKKGIKWHASTYVSVYLFSYMLIM